MARLTAAQQRFVVQRVACFDTHLEVIEAVKERYGLTLTLQRVAGYDPGTVTGARDLSKALKAYFEEQRALAKTDEDAIPISHRAVRLRTLDKIRVSAMARKNYALAMSAMEQAAMEMGDKYTNTSVVRTPDGVPAFVVRREADRPEPGTNPDASAGPGQES